MPFAMMAPRLAASPLGVAATWISAAGGPPVELRGVPTRPSEMIAGMGPVGGRSIAAFLMIPAAALPGPPVRDDLIAFAGRSYKVATVEPDARGASFTLGLRTT